MECAKKVKILQLVQKDNNKYLFAIYKIILCNVSVKMTLLFCCKCAIMLGLHVVKGDLIMSVSLGK